MRAPLAIAFFLLLAAASLEAGRPTKEGYEEQGGPGGGGGGGAGSEQGPGGNGGNGGGIGGGEGGQGGWGGPVSEGTDAECIEVARLSCPAVDGVVPVLLSNPSDCGSFCQCANGVGKFIPCANGLHFNKDTQVCDWPWMAGCRNVMIPN
ncbi:uncharacterized protein LOC135946806 [Cloeon dipterum]|uniref:uncharacterized protein LOC135946806 n=1 Tax=Cloeon dipterum TaxID=197152 RepID=UPI00322092D2